MPHLFEFCGDELDMLCELEHLPGTEFIKAALDKACEVAPQHALVVSGSSLR
jgi:hypothetical protein